MGTPTILWRHNAIEDYRFDAIALLINTYCFYNKEGKRTRSYFKLNLGEWWERQHQRAYAEHYRCNGLVASIGIVVFSLRKNTFSRIFLNYAKCHHSCFLAAVTLLVCLSDIITVYAYQQRSLNIQDSVVVEVYVADLVVLVSSRI